MLVVRDLINLDRGGYYPCTILMQLKKQETSTSLDLASEFQVKVRFI